MNTLQQIVAAVAAMGISGGAVAATSTTSLQVSTTVSGGGSCTVSANPIIFTYDPDPSTLKQASGNVAATCTLGTFYAIALDRGLHGSFGTSFGRQMLGPVAIAYDLFSDSSDTVIWGDQFYGNTYSDGQPVFDTGSGSAQNHPVYGLMQVTGNEPAGSYTDTVTVTVNY